MTKRHRPLIHTTISPYTMSILMRIAEEHAFGRIGQTLDYIVADWVGLKRSFEIQHQHNTDPMFHTPRCQCK